MNRIILFASLIFITLVAAQGRAEVKASGKRGFELELTTKIAAPVDKTYAALIDIASWWHPDHTFSGDAKNLYLETKPHGWFGERLVNDGFVKHMEVAHLAPKKTLRLLGGLGPLQEMGIHGALTIKLRPIGESETEVVWTYNVSGFSSMDLTKLAPIVDGVLKQQLARLAVRAAK